MSESVKKDTEFDTLIDFLRRVPAIETNDSPSLGIGTGSSNGRWWIKFSIDIDHPLAWSVVQELGHILNYLSLNEKLPTVFMPVSPPPYMNGGARDFLSWVIESVDPNFTPDIAAEWLEGRMPKPVEDIGAWQTG